MLFARCLGLCCSLSLLTLSCATHSERNSGGRASVAPASTAPGGSVPVRASVEIERRRPVTSEIEPPLTVESTSETEAGNDKRGLVLLPADQCELNSNEFAQVLGERELVGLSACVLSGDARPRRAVDGAVVYPGDELTFAVRTARRAFVYLLHSQHEKVELLWPPETEILSSVVMPEEPLVIPGSAYRLVLDDRVGPITVYVVASTQPLKRTDPLLFGTASSALPGGAQLSAASSAPAKTSADSRPASGARQASVLQAAPLSTRGSLARRGIVRERKDVGVVLGEPDSSGVVVIEYHLNHVLRP